MNSLNLAINDLLTSWESVGKVSLSNFMEEMFYGRNGEKCSLEKLLENWSLLVSCRVFASIFWNSQKFLFRFSISVQQHFSEFSVSNLVENQRLRNNFLLWTDLCPLLARDFVCNFCFITVSEVPWSFWTSVEQDFAKFVEMKWNFLHENFSMGARKLKYDTQS